MNQTMYMISYPDGLCLCLCRYRLPRRTHLLGHLSVPPRQQSHALLLQRRRMQTRLLRHGRGHRLRHGDGSFVGPAVALFC